jgi:hypothetical protein
MLAGRTTLLVTHDPLEAIRLGHALHVITGQPARLGNVIVPPGAPPRDAAGSLAAASGAASRRACRFAGHGRGMTRVFAPLVTAAGLLALWQAVVLATGVPAYILPPPTAVVTVLVTRYDCCSITRR